MNSLGRHYRDQTDPTNPSCDYEQNGVKCTFFTSGNEYAALPYPSDISTGPVTDNTPSSSDLASIMALLQQQKADSDHQRALQQQQAEQMRLLQEQVGTILRRDAPMGATVTVTNPQPSSSVTNFSHSSLSSVTTTSTFSMPSLATYTSTTAPQVITSAAAGFSASLQAGLGQNQGNLYTGLTMEHLRSDPELVSRAAAALANVTNQVPPLNPLEGVVNPARSGLLNNQVINSVDQLYRATTVNKQLRCYEFAATGQFSYRNLLKQDNCNAVTFAFGAFKHLEACKSGLINVSDTEFLSRLRHLKNVFEIACLSSKLESFTEHSWLVAREYDTRVIADIESGAKTWDNLSVGIEPDAIYCAKETVEIRTKLKKPKDPKDRKLDDKKPQKKLCTTYNTHRSSEGCYWEHTNQGQVCVFDHYCSWCKQNRNVVEKHKALNCEHKSE